MNIRFIKSWRQYRVGQEFDFADGMATELVKRGIVVKVELEEPRKKSKKEYMIPPVGKHV